MPLRPAAHFVGLTRSVLVNISREPSESAYLMHCGAWATLNWPSTDGLSQVLSIVAQKHRCIWHPSDSYAGTLILSDSITKNLHQARSTTQQFSCVSLLAGVGESHVEQIYSDLRLRSTRCSWHLKRISEWPPSARGTPFHSRTATRDTTDSGSS
jgi:hypothetical protein